MSYIIYSEAFIDDVEYLYQFLHDKNPTAAQKFAKMLNEKIEIVATMPQAFTLLGEYHLYFLAFGASGYAVLYDYNEQADTVLLLRIKHQKEAGF